MDSERKTAYWVGGLYVVATVAGVAAIGPWSTLTADEGILYNASAHENQLFLAGLLYLVMAVAVAGVAFMIYPVLRRVARGSFEQGMALWYVGTRLTESALFLVATVGLFAILPLSREFVAAGSPEDSYFQTAAALLQDGSDYGWMMGQAVFAVGAVMLYGLLYRYRLVPRWISLWGLVTAPLFLTATLSLPFTGDPDSTFSTVLYAPFALQEMVLAGWLIFKGFSAGIVVEEPVDTVVGEPAEPSPA